MNKRKVIPVLLLILSLQLSAMDLAPLGKWLNAQKQVNSVSSNFIQTRKLASLDKEIVTKGKLWVNYPDRFHWQMGVPAKALILRNGETIQFHNLRKGKTDTFNVNSSEGRRYAFMTSQFASSLADFQKSFEVKKVWLENGVYYCLFTSKKLALRKRVPFLALGIYLKTNKLGLFEMHLEDKSVIRTTFTDYQINGVVDEAKFTLSE